MSHHTDLVSAAEYTCTPCLQRALARVAAMRQGLTVTDREAAGKIFVRYPAIEVYQRDGNLRFEKRGEQWVPVGDFYHVEKELRGVLDDIEIQYASEAARLTAEELGFSIQDDVTRDHVRDFVAVEY